MAYNDRGNERVQLGLKSASLWVALYPSASGSELSGNGYSRPEATTANITVSSAGVATLPSNMPMYTATSASAVQATHFNIHTHATNDTPIYSTNQAIPSPPAAPVNGQTLQLSITLNP